MDIPYEFETKTIIKEGRTTQGAINTIKEWIVTTSLPQLPEPLIVLFLLSCQSEVLATQHTIQAYFRIKMEAPEIFCCRDVDSEELKKATNVVHCISLPVRMNNNTVIHFFKINDTNYHNFDWILSMKIAYMLLDISQRRNPPNELVVLIDMKGLGFMHLTRLRIGAVKKFLEFLQEAMPLRIKQIHIMNTNYIFDKLIALARVFIKSELMAIIKTHPPNIDLLQFHKEWIPATCLPKEYGGELPTSEEMNDMCIQQFRELKPFFEAEEKLINLYKN